MKIRRGSTSVRRYIFIGDSSSTTGAGLASLVHNSASLVAHYIAGDLSNEVVITLVTATLGSYTDSGFIAVDNTNMPGWYEIGIPNAALDAGNEVAIQLRGAANMVPVNIYIELDAFDYQTATQPVNVIQISGDTTAADTLELFAEALDQSTGQIDSGTLAASTITATSIAANAITDVKIATGAITATTFAGGAINAAAIASAAITEAKIASATITAAKFGPSAIDSAVIATGAITSSKFAAGAINAAAIATDAIDADALAADAIAEINATVDTALADIHLDHLLAVDYDPATKPGAPTALLNELVENNAGVSRYTAGALAQAPTGGSAPTVGQIADAVWTEVLAPHIGAGNAAEALDAAGTAGDPWVTALPGAYGSGTAGKIIGDNLNATVSSRATQTSVDDVPTVAEFNARSLPNADYFVVSDYTVPPTTGQILTALGTGTWMTAIGDTRMANLDAAVSSRLATAGYTAPANADITLILADTNEMQTDLANGGRLDLILDIIAADTTTDIPSQITALNNLSAANILTQVNAALDAAITELGAIPSATPSTRAALMLLYMALRNRTTTTASAQTIQNDAGTTIATATLSDDGTTMTKAEFA